MRATVISGIILFAMVMIVLVYNFGMRLYNDYRKDKQRELEFLKRKEEYRESSSKYQSRK